MTRSESFRGARYLKLVLLFAALDYVMLLALSRLIFLVEHIHPKPLISMASSPPRVAVETMLGAPRKIMLWLWPWETTPSGLRFALTLINRLTWDVGLTGLRAFWCKAIR